MSSLDYNGMSDDELKLFGQNLVQKMTDNGTAWHVTSAQILTISTPLADFVTKYALTLDPATKTSLTISAKNVARKTFIAALRPFVHLYVYDNNYMDVTARLSCMCPEHSTNHTPYGHPTTVPRAVASVSTTGPQRVLVEVYNEDGARPTQTPPAGVRMIMFRLKVGGAPPEGPEDCPIVLLSPVMRLTIQRTAAEKGLMLYILVCYIGNDGSQGTFIARYIEQTIS